MLAFLFYFLYICVNVFFMRNEDKKTCTCEVCGKIFPYKHGYGVKTCSKECLIEMRKQIFTKRVKKICKNCGNEYEQKQYMKSEFCCMNCYWEYRNNHKEEFSYIGEKRKENSHEIRKCELCGKEFYVYKKDKKRFCSDKCRVEYEKTEEFKQKRKNTILEKYGCDGYHRKWTNEQHDKYDSVRYEKYNKLCEKSNLEIIEYIDKHKLKVKCKKCNYEFITNNLSYLPYEKILCKNCSEEYKLCKPSIMICEFLDQYNIDYIKNDRTIIKPYELDIVIPKYNLCIEINGNFWHSEICGKDSKYHLNKTILANKNGYKLIHIFEDEILNKFNIVKSRILSKLNIYDNKIYARKCNIKEIDKDIKKIFLNETHIQGDTNSTINLGLFYNNELVSVMTFSKERIIYKNNTKDDSYELIRFSSKLNTIIIGGFSKLLKFFIKKYSPKSIKTFADIRWSSINHETTVYEKNGFNFIKATKPNYWYMHKSNILKRLHRYNFTKFNILKKNDELDSKKTEWELMQELGYNRIWDCGNLRFELII